MTRWLRARSEPVSESPDGNEQPTQGLGTAVSISAKDCWCVRHWMLMCYKCNMWDDKEACHLVRDGAVFVVGGRSAGWRIVHENAS